MQERFLLRCDDFSIPCKPENKSLLNRPKLLAQGIEVVDGTSVPEVKCSSVQSQAENHMPSTQML